LKNQGAVRPLLFLVLFFYLCGFAEAAVDIRVANPWLALMTRFVGGLQVQVHALSGWNAAGGVVRYLSSSRRFPAIALDEAEARTFRLGKSGVKTLFTEAPVGISPVPSAFFDPSALSFIGQRLLGAMSSIDPKNYVYYQRRLAEFQSRTDTTVGVGRQLLKGLVILDLTGASGKWILAAAESPVRPPDRVMNLWKKGRSLETLGIALNEASRKNWVIAVDPWTPSNVREKVRGLPRVAEIPPPSQEKEMLTILHDVYLAVWNASGKRLNPQKP